MADITQNPKMLFILCVWLLFIVIFLRAILRTKIVSKRSQQLWLIFFLCCVAFTFWGEDSERALDQFFGYRPMALLVKYICLISVAHLFYSLLNNVKAKHSLIPMKWISPLAIVGGLIGFIAYDLYKPFPSSDLRFLFIGTRDAIVMVYALFSFIPGTLMIRAEETIGLMHFKLSMIILCSLSFVLTALGSIAAALLALLKIGDPSLAASTVQPFVILGIVFFVLIMIPHRWFLSLLQLRRFYIYYRLLGLEREMLKHIGASSSNKLDISVFIYPKELELSIYRLTISVLDYYPLLDGGHQSHMLYSKLQKCIVSNPDYTDLVEEMAHL